MKTIIRGKEFSGWELEKYGYLLTIDHNIELSEREWIFVNSLNPELACICIDIGNNRWRIKKEIRSFRKIKENKWNLQINK